MDKFDERKWFKNQYIEENQSPKKLREQAISPSTYDKMDKSANQRKLSQLSTLIQELGDDWENNLFDHDEIIDFLEGVVYDNVKS
tara:strand:- start:111 stop:365 length:255 start_codon:yes stop_codon:yes gene_type:complete